LIGKVKERILSLYIEIILPLTESFKSIFCENGAAPKTGFFTFFGPKLLINCYSGGAAEYTSFHRYFPAFAVVQESWTFGKLRCPSAVALVNYRMPLVSVRQRNHQSCPPLAPEQE
jgi:hypothetical protein